MKMIRTAQDEDIYTCTYIYIYILWERVENLLPITGAMQVRKRVSAVPVLGIALFAWGLLAEGSAIRLKLVLILVISLAVVM